MDPIIHNIMHTGMDICTGTLTGANDLLSTANRNKKLLYWAVYILPGSSGVSIEQLSNGSMSGNVA